VAGPATSLIPLANASDGSFNYSAGVAKLMAARKAGVALVEASADRIVVDTKVGRIIIEPEQVRFHRAGRGRGRTLLNRESLA
jgi:hypothetical protein